MFDSGGTPPPAPDYAGIAQQQGIYNQRATDQATTANRPTINTPWGTQSWETTPGALAFDEEIYNRDLAAYNTKLDEFERTFGTRDPNSIGGGKRITALKNQLNPGAAPDRNSDAYTSYGPDQWTMNTTLDPELQSALDSQFRLQNRKAELAGGMTERLFDAYKDPFSFKDIPGLPGDMTQITTDTYNKLRALSDPYTEREDAALESSLANKGINIGNEQWTAQKQQRGDELNRQDIQRQLTALREGRDEASSQINIRNAAINSQLLERAVPLNEMNAILSGQQVSLPTMPTFTNAGTAAPVDIAGAARDQSDYNADLFNYGQTQQSQRDQAGVQGLSTAAMIAAMFAMSDGRLKKIIKRIGTTDRGTPLYLYEMGGKIQVGVIAQESPKEAVRERADGWLEVDYMRV
jgi:hypothetical protein